MLATAANPHSERSTGKHIPPYRQRFFHDVVNVTQRETLHPGIICDTWSTSQQPRDLSSQLRVIRSNNLQFFPVLLHLDRRINGTQQFTKIVPQLAAHTLANGGALYRDFRKKLNNKMHEGNESPRQGLKGARLYYKRSQIPLMMGTLRKAIAEAAPK